MLRIPHKKEHFTSLGFIASFLVIANASLISLDMYMNSTKQPQFSSFSTSYAQEDRQGNVSGSSSVNNKDAKSSGDASNTHQTTATSSSLVADNAIYDAPSSDNPTAPHQAPPVTPAVEEEPVVTEPPEEEPNPTEPPIEDNPSVIDDTEAFITSTADPLVNAVEDTIDCLTSCPLENE